MFLESGYNHKWWQIFIIMFISHPYLLRAITEPASLKICGVLKKKTTLGKPDLRVFDRRIE
jgi:hypothetical protein